LFIVPTIYALYKKKYACSAVSLISMTASIFYWIHPVPGIRKNIDLSLSKFAGIFYFMYGYHNIDNNFLRVLGYSNGMMILLFYRTSCYLYNIQSKHWVLSHVCFHVCTVLGKMITLL
jgi:hypothetical protein